MRTIKKLHNLWFGKLLLLQSIILPILDILQKVQIQDKVDSLFKKKPSSNGIEENIKIGESITPDTNNFLIIPQTESEGITISKVETN